MAGKIDALNEEIVAKENELIDAQAEYASLQEAYDEAVKDFYDSQRADGSGRSGQRREGRDGCGRDPE